MNSQQQQFMKINNNKTNLKKIKMQGKGTHFDEYDQIKLID